MKRSELAHLLRSASRIADDPNILVIGSQSVLGMYDADTLPPEATLSNEADIAFFDDPEAGDARALRLSPHDCVTSMLAACREKDREFAAALIHAGLINPALLRKRAAGLPLAYQRHVLSWIDNYGVTLEPGRAQHSPKVADAALPKLPPERSALPSARDSQKRVRPHKHDGKSVKGHRRKKPKN